MNEYEQQVIDALANRDHIVIYEQPGIIKRSGRLTAEEGANLTLREKNLYLWYKDIKIHLEKINDKNIEHSIWGDVDASFVLAWGRKLERKT